MNKFERLENTVHNLKIEYVSSPSKHFGGLICGQIIYINQDLPKQQQYQWLAEEISHYDYTVGDITKCNTIEQRKQECLARTKAMEELVPLDGLIDCFINGICKVDEIADYFEVTPDYLQTAIKSYCDRRGCMFNYHGYRFDLCQGLNIEKIN